MDSGSLTSADDKTSVDDKTLKHEEVGAGGVTDKEVSDKEIITSTAGEGAVEDHRMSNEIQELARRYSTHKSTHEPSEMLFPVPADTGLDPSSPNFDARAWAKAFYASRSAAANGQMRTAGIAFNNLDVYGYGTSADYQSTVANVVLGAVDVYRKLTGKKQERIDILRGLEGLVESGEMLCVLGPPGSGCSTTLKTIAGDTYGFHVGEGSTLNYQGIRAEQIKKAYRGEAVYTAEVDNHFAHLTVNDTLYFAARARCPRNIPDGIDRQEYAEHLRDVIMAIFGISHTKNTQVGNDFVRGVSGGERKRVTIAEAALGYAPLQCWDNSTRGLDSANAVEFCKTLRTQADTLGCTSAVAIYQAPQAAYELFDKVLVLYEGRQIYFGRADEARAYFEALGFVCPEQQTTPDFLTSMTSEAERVIRDGFEGRTPRTADEFAKCWRDSQVRAQLVRDIEAYIAAHPFDSHDHDRFLESRRSDQSSMTRPNSPFNLSLFEQFKLNFWRSWIMLKGDPAITISMLVINFFQSIIIASIFYNLPENTSSFYRRTVLLFFVVLMNAFGSVIEIMTLYEKRKIIEKHARYAFYHPMMESLASIIIDMPYKVVNAIIMNVTIYFMCNLRREPGPFFFFLLFSFVMTVTISMLFRFMASATKSLEQALAPSAILLVYLVLYSGFSIPPQYMQNWLGWLRWLNPVYYGLESAFLNEFVGRSFPCSEIVPAGPGYPTSLAGEPSLACSVAGAVPGEANVDGGAFLYQSFGFVNSHRWTNLAVMIAYMVLFLGLHLFTTEFVASSRSKGEVLVFTREFMKKQRKLKGSSEEGGDVEKGGADARQRQGKDVESDGNVEGMEKQTAIFHWKDVCYDIKIKTEERRILDNVDGWVKPGTLTALMGVSGAGKTTLLDVLASRVTMGVVTGDMRIDGNPRDLSFQRQTGYVQQQDIHLATSTVREALTFSALLRQPAHYTKEEKLAYVDTVIGLLDMEEYSDAIVGVPGEGLNVEQRKRLTIGVELAARPQLLLFLDEPTSGLDSQTSWSICNLMEKLTRNGQAILCTIHQPSAMLFQRFDRLLLLAKGGRTVYFGEIGKNSRTLMDYFIRNGGPALPHGANPAEHMLEVIGAAPGAHTEIDWPAVWRASPEYQGVQDELVRLCENPIVRTKTGQEKQDAMYSEFAAPMSVQMAQVTKRLFQQYWRRPSYIYSKFLLSAGIAFCIGISIINSANTTRGLQNQLFGVFLFLTIFNQIANQLFTIFVEQRTQYEARERPSKSYSWLPFMVANIIAEFAWNSLMGIFCFIVWYFPMGLYHNAEYTDQVHSRGITVFLFVWAFLLLSSSFAHCVIAGMPTPEAAGGILALIFIMMFAFCGVLAGPDQLPGFWIFMYRVNPMTYVVDGFLATTLANAPVTCAANELIHFAAANGSTCGEYLETYMGTMGGYLANGSGDGTDCEFCPIKSTNDFLASINSHWSDRWRNFGFLWVYISVNIAGALFFYWLARVPKKSNVKVKKE